MNSCGGSSAPMMMSPFSKTGPAFTTLGMILVLGAAARGGLPYLPLIGPPPLRVQTLRPPTAGVVKFTPEAKLLSGTNDAAATPTNDTALAAAPFGTTNDADAGSMTTPAGAPAAERPDQSLGDNFTASVFALPTPDLLGITPQMLAAYFHPVPGGTNMILTGPFHVSFIPPQPPDKAVKSSHAEYIVK